MANKTIFISDLTGKELEEKDAVRITVTDKSNGKAFVVDAARTEPEAKLLMEKGKAQAVRGRKSESK